MVDKLEKNGHKLIYYRLRALSFILIIVLALTAILAIPVGISYRLAAEGLKASEASSSLINLLKMLTPLF